MYGALALEKLIEEYDFETVIDIGSGAGSQSKLLESNGKKVRRIDIRKTGENYMTTELEKYDCAWCCHVLEHQPNINLFLKKITNDVVKGGIIAITVPPAKDEIVGGHISIWNAGLLVYNLVMAGIDCSMAKIKQYGYNISAIVRNYTFEMPSDLYSDKNELEVLSEYLPSFIGHDKTGVIGSYNW